MQHTDVIYTGIDAYIKRIESWKTMPTQPINREAMERQPYRTQGYFCESCLEWVWLQSIKGASHELIISTVSQVLNDSIELFQKDLPHAKYRGEHGVLCLNLAAFAGSHSQLEGIARSMVANAHGRPPSSSDEAWAYCLSFWILGEYDKAFAHFDAVYALKPETTLRQPRKPLLRAFLARQWPLFDKALKKTYESLWSKLIKTPYVSRRSNTSLEMDMHRRNCRVDAYWQDTGLIALGLRYSVDMALDAQWFSDELLSIVRKSDAG